MGGHVERRERVARIIDPEAWVLRGWNDNWREVKARKQEIALEKADVILSAHRQTIEALVGALGNLLKYAERNECAHEETHRGGSIWTICDGCGQKWADDRGGFVSYKEPSEIAIARAALLASKEGRL